MSSHNSKGNGQAGVQIHSLAKPARLAILDLKTRQKMVAEAAYYAAERRGFTAGFELDDWLTAERELDGRTAAKSG
jgi:hypothetical protein